MCVAGPGCGFNKPALKLLSCSAKSAHFCSGILCVTLVVKSPATVSLVRYVHTTCCYSVVLYSHITVIYLYVGPIVRGTNSKRNQLKEGPNLIGIDCMRYYVPTVRGANGGTVRGTNCMRNQRTSCKSEQL